MLYFKADPDVSIDYPRCYSILIPRMLSSFMMHLQVESDISNGLSIMKYAVNHPWLFAAQKFKASDEDDTGNEDQNESKQAAQITP